MDFPAPLCPMIAVALPDGKEVSVIETDKIMIDLAGYYKKINKNGRDTLNWRDHGMLFKMWPQDLPLLFGEPEIYYLDEM